MRKSVKTTRNVVANMLKKEKTGNALTLDSILVLEVVITRSSAHQSGKVPAFAEFSAVRDGSPPGPAEFSADAVLDYVQDMCVTLAYLSDAHKFAYLTALLEAAAAEAKRHQHAEVATLHAASMRSETS